MDFNEKYKLLTDKNHIYEEVSYNRLMDLVNGFTTGIFYIGGPWCESCQLIIEILNDVCKKNNIDVIYNYDPKFINILKEEEDLRDCKSLEVKLKYYELVEKIGFNNSTEECVKDTLISKMHVPFIFGMRNGTCVDFFSMELSLHNGKDELKDEAASGKIEFISRLNELINKTMRV